jgi:hypothetical protein
MSAAALKAAQQPEKDKSKSVKLECGHTMTMQAMLTHTEGKQWNVQPLIEGKGDKGKGMQLLLIADNMAVITCPIEACKCQHSAMHLSTIRSAATDTLTLKRLIGKVHFAEENGHTWTHHIGNAADGLFYMPTNATDCSKNKIADFVAQLLAIVKGQGTTDFHILHCPCSESKCQGFMIQQVSQCMHCTHKDK